MIAFYQFTGGFLQYNVCSYACFAYRYSPSSLLVCGGEINAQMGNISSPGYPNTPYFPEDQHDDNIRCHWKLRPPSGSYVMLTLENFFLGRKEWDHRRLVNSYNLGQMPWDKFAFVICGFFTCPTSPLRLRIQPFLLALRRKGRCISVPLTVGRTSWGGGEGGEVATCLWGFFDFLPRR